MSRYIDADKLMLDIRLDKRPTFRGAKIPPSVKETMFAYLDSAPHIDLVRCAECLWARPRTLKGETGYRCLFYRVDKAEDGYCDNGEREGE